MDEPAVLPTEQQHRAYLRLAKTLANEITSKAAGICGGSGLDINTVTTMLIGHVLGHHMHNMNETPTSEGFVAIINVVADSAHEVLATHDSMMAWARGDA